MTKKLLPHENGVLAFDSLKLKEITIGPGQGRDYDKSSFKDSDLSEITFKQISLRESQFVGSVLDAVIFYGADLSASSFEKSWIFECDIIDCQLNGVNFSNLIDQSSIYVRIDGKRTVLIGRDAIGYLAFNGAKVDDIDEYFIFKYHPKFQIVMKICEKLVEQKNRQEIGLVQKGAARKDTDLASDFVAMLMRRGLTKYDRTMIAITPEGRKVLPSFVEHQKMPPDIAEFLRSH